MCLTQQPQATQALFPQCQPLLCPAAVRSYIPGISGKQEMSGNPGMNGFSGFVGGADCVGDMPLSTSAILSMLSPPFHTYLDLMIALPWLLHFSCEFFCVLLLVRLFVCLCPFATYLIAACLMSPGIIPFVCIISSFLRQMRPFHGTRSATRCGAPLFGLH